MFELFACVWLGCDVNWDVLGSRYEPRVGPNYRKSFIFKFWLRGAEGARG